MELTFGLFARRADVEKAANELLRRGFDEANINVLVRHQAARGGAPEQAGKHEELAILGRLLSRGKEVVLGRDGTMVCSGRNANNLVDAAIDAGHDSVLSMLEQFLAPAHAAAYADGVREGGMLVWIDDERGEVNDAEAALHYGEGVSVTSIEIPEEFDFRRNS